MTTLENERLYTRDDLVRALSEPLPALTPAPAPEPVPEPEPGLWQELVLRHRVRADAGEGFWGERPAGLRTLKDFVKHERVTLHVWEPFNVLEGIWGYGVALPVCGLIYGALKVARLPLTTESFEAGPPTLSQLRGAYQERGTIARIYGRGVLVLHELGYLLAGQIQVPGRLALTVAIAALFPVTHFWIG